MRRAGCPGHAPLADAPTRSVGLARLASFVPHAANYARERNRAVPPHDRVSRLSPYLRHRLILEREAVAAVLDAHPRESVDTFVSEVLWRTYWKGWLELRPHVWDRYLDQLRRDRDGLAGASSIRYAEAIAGRSGMACFDAWARELIETGYLHNHARMWFASIWIFTLRLPWTLGAAFFLRHLLDGDPASNTLSWRWVAGLHTRGKHYLARAENIARYTDGRFDPKGELDEQAPPLTEPPLDLKPRLLPASVELETDLPSGLLLTPEDLAPEVSQLSMRRFQGVAGGWDETLGKDLDFAPPVVDFSRGAIGDALSRAEAHFAVLSHALDETDWLAATEAWARDLAVRRVVTLETPVGRWRERLEQLDARLANHGIALVRSRRTWDSSLWPGATRGFFPFREHARRQAHLGGLRRTEQPQPG
ncbi:FAD-binding domain-containing protein [Thiocapsa bogorovii]|uniref:FAD-binding domain-containing protein n=1 Tax=Thiocapsa bogorovii TaxID=521689 RepID=UPI001E41D0F5|nr:FAD-binding domain-containing protein [Thiocapsa bogorovii]UHD18393.1 DNA photolyase FAD-binding protein [Thiocapsa bogorovii]